MKGDLIKEIEGDFNGLIKRGLNLEGAFKAEQNIKPDHIKLISNWISEVIDYVEPVVPNNYPKLDEVRRVKEIYAGVVSVLPGDSGEHIRQVLDCVRDAYKFFRYGVSYDVTRLSPKVQADIWYLQIKETADFAKRKVIGKLIGQEDGRTKKTAMLHIYGRMYAWIGSMAKLNSRNDYQALASCLRAILELYVDLNLLSREVIENGIEKFFSLADVTKFKTAKNSLRLNREFEHLSSMESIHMEEFINEPPDKETKIRELRKKLWGETKRLDHWSGLIVVKRVEKLGDEFMKLYQRVYHYCNWNVHSGYSLFPGGEEDSADMFVAHAYSSGNEMFFDAMEVLKNEVGVLDSKELVQDVKKVQMVSARLYWEESVKGALMRC